MSIESRELRNLLGRFPTGVCVITAISPEGIPQGMTANSFASVSLDPPLVLWSLQNSSEVFDTFAAPRNYAINVLTAEQVGLSNQYARKGDHALSPAHFRLGRHGAPIIRDALVSFECELYATHDGGDHQIIVGRVRDTVARAVGQPLLFYCGAYRELH